MICLEIDKNDLPTSEQLASEVKRRRYNKNFRKILINTLASLIVAASIAVIISVLFLPVLRVTGTSMQPTLQNDELIVCRKRSDFKRGDIVAFYYNNKVLLKRVIALSGDVVDISDDGTVYINSVAIKEPYISEKALGECDIEFPYQVPDNKIFVMGDHRKTSIDSRTKAIGSIADEAVVGKVIFRVWPFKQMDKLS